MKGQNSSRMDSLSYDAEAPPKRNQTALGMSPFNATNYSLLSSSAAVQSRNNDRHNETARKGFGVRGEGRKFTAGVPNGIRHSSVTHHQRSKTQHGRATAPYGFKEDLNETQPDPQLGGGFAIQKLNKKVIPMG